MKQNLKKLIPIFITTVAVVVAALFAITSIKKSHQLTGLELQAFTEKSTKLMNFFEQIDNPNDLDEPSRQTAYALETLYAEKPQKTYGINEVQETINASFANPANILEPDFRPEVSDIHMFYDDQERKFISNKDAISHKEIIHTPITKYVLISVKKRKDTYVANYEKYVFEEPYMIIDRTSQDETKGEHSVGDYLDGKGTVLALKELVNSTNAKDICEPEKTITITFQADGNQLKIQSYE